MFAKHFLKIFLIILANSLSTSSQSCHNPQVVDLILFNFYITPNQFQVYNVHNLHEILNHPNFDRNRNTTIYHYGLSQTPSTPSNVETINAYMTHGNDNFILVNYESIATNIIFNACTLGESIAEALIQLFNRGYELSRIHLVGFSFGATVWSIAGREVISRTNRQHMIERITGLDPGQVQDMFPLTGRLGSGDARFVDTIHTESNGFGDHEARGDVQFFVNGGVIQPMCDSLSVTIAQTCSHLFASSVWVESVRIQRPIFPSLQCDSWNHFLANNCNLNARIGNMGVITSSELRGQYFLRTNLEAPFSRDQPGP